MDKVGSMDRNLLTKVFKGAGDEVGEGVEL